MRSKDNIDVYLVLLLINCVLTLFLRSENILFIFLFILYRTDSPGVNPNRFKCVKESA